MGLSVINWGGVVSPNLSETSKYPLQTDVATKELQRIENLKASTSGYGMSKLSNASDVTNVDSYALSAIQNNPSIDGTLNNRLTRVCKDYYREHRYVYEYSALTPGWYRIIKVQYHITSVVAGSLAPAFQLYIHRVYTYGVPENHHIGCNILYNDSKFYNIASASKIHMITKIRHCISNDATYAAFDIYYNYNYENGIDLILDTLGCGYITPALPIVTVPEISDTETIVSAFNIPANAFFTSG